LFPLKCEQKETSYGRKTGLDICQDSLKIRFVRQATGHYKYIDSLLEFEKLNNHLLLFLAKNSNQIKRITSKVVKDGNNTFIIHEGCVREHDLCVKLCNCSDFPIIIGTVETVTSPGLPIYKTS
jgi:hypothetical protein